MGFAIAAVSRHATLAGSALQTGLVRQQIKL